MRCLEDSIDVSRASTSTGVRSTVLFASWKGSERNETASHEGVQPRGCSRCRYLSRETNMSGVTQSDGDPIHIYFRCSGLRPELRLLAVGARRESIAVVVQYHGLTAALTDVHPFAWLFTCGGHDLAPGIEGKKCCRLVRRRDVCPTVTHAFRSALIWSDTVLPIPRSGGRS